MDFRVDEDLSQLLHVQLDTANLAGKKVYMLKTAKWHW